MSCNKFVFAAAALAVASLAHAVVSPVVIQPMSAVQPKKATTTPAVDPFAQKGPVQMPVAAPVGASTTAPVGASAVAVPAPVALESHLSLGQVNDAARAKVLKSLRDSVQTAPIIPVSAQVPAPIFNQVPPPMPATLAPAAGDMRAVSVRPAVVAPTDPVAIVGTMVDAQSSRVLYSYNGGIYTAALNQKMLNGVTAKAIHGMRVTVTDGKRSWDVPVAAVSSKDSDQ